MAFGVQFPIRFHHVDHARLVYFPRYFDFCHQAFEDFFAAEVGLTYAEFFEQRGVGFPVVHTESDFRRPFRFGETCRIVLETLHVGKGSATHRYRFYRAQESVLHAEVKLTTASIQIEPLCPAPLPDDVRAVFARHSASEP